MAIKEDIADRINKIAQFENVNASNSSGYFERDLRRSKFDVNVNQFPSNLGSEELLHYIEFSINVRGRSEFNKSNRTFEVKRDLNSANLSSEQLSTSAKLGAGIAVGAVTAGIVKEVLGKVTKTGGIATVLGSKAAADATITAAAGIGAAALTAAGLDFSGLLKPDTSHRITDVIALHVDSPPVVKYGMNYANKELGTFAGILGNVFNGKMTGEGAAAFGMSMAKVPGAFGVMDLQSTISAATKVALNPFKEVIFESVDFRSFAFKYRFLPKSKEESEIVKKIISLFKFHMHPEISDQKLFFIYPSEFQITYYYSSAQNSYFHKMAPCVLESMEVAYGGENFSSFSDGNPTEVYMTLVFRETEILTKKMMEDGY